MATQVVYLEKTSTTPIEDLIQHSVLDLGNDKVILTEVKVENTDEFQCYEIALKWYRFN